MTDPKLRSKSASSKRNRAFGEHPGSYSMYSYSWARNILKPKYDPRTSTNSGPTLQSVSKDRFRNKGPRTHPPSRKTRFHKAGKRNGWNPSPLQTFWTWRYRLHPETLKGYLTCRLIPCLFCWFSYFGLGIYSHKVGYKNGGRRDTTGKDQL